MEDIYFDGINVFNEITLSESENFALFFKNNDYLLLKDILTDEIKTYLKIK